MKILYVEDNYQDADLTVRILKKNAPDYKMDIVATQTDALARLDDDYDLVLTDMKLPDGDGIQIISQIRLLSLPLAVVLLTGQGDEEIAVAAIKIGADDYIIKQTGYLDSLHTNLEHALKNYKKNALRQKKPIQVFYVDHHKADIDLTKRHFKRHAPNIRLETATDEKDLFGRISDSDTSFNFDVILLDYRLPGANAIDILKKMKMQYKMKVPIVLVTGQGDEKIAASALKLGACDYIVKTNGYLFKLPWVLENAWHSTLFRREHAALKKSEKQYRDLYDNAPDMFFSVDAKTAAIIDCNQTMIKTLGFSKQEIFKKNIFDLYTQQSAEYSKHFLFPSFLRTGKIIGEELQILPRNQIPMDVLLNASAVYDSNGGILYSRSIWHDITEKKRVENEKKQLEENLRQAQKMEAIGTLAGGIAHDFNNILSIIIGNTEIALEDVPRSNSGHSNLKNIRKASLRAAHIVKQLLGFSRKSKQKLKPIEIVPVIKDVLKFLRSTIPSTIEIKEDIQSLNVIILGNATKINQIIMNLCINASHAMEKTGGQLQITLKALNLETNNLELNLDPGDYIKLSVCDTGPGIDPEIRDKIFDPYFTTKKVGKGTGLGLALVHSLVGQLKGKINLESEFGKGACFNIFFPMITEKPEAKAEKHAEPEKGNETILFIDDEEDIATLFGLVLKRLGYQVVTETNPVKALKLFRLDPDRFDLVITDMTMPQMTGRLLSEKLFKIRKDLPVIVCSGHSDLLNKEKARALGIAAYIEKPIPMQRLAKIIRRVLDKSNNTILNIDS